MGTSPEIDNIAVSGVTYVVRVHRFGWRRARLRVLQPWTPDVMEEELVLDRYRRN